MCTKKYYLFRVLSFNGFLTLKWNDRAAEYIQVVKMEIQIFTYWLNKLALAYK